MQSTAINAGSVGPWAVKLQKCNLATCSMGSILWLPVAATVGQCDDRPHGAYVQPAIEHDTTATRVHPVISNTWANTAS